MRLLHLTYLNVERLRIVADDFLAKIPPPAHYYGSSESAASASSSSTSPLSVFAGLAPSAPSLFLPTPREVAEREPLWFLPLRPPSKRSIRIEFGVPFERFAGATRWSEDDVQAALGSDGSYLVGLSTSPRRRSPRSRSIVVAIASGATPLQQTKAYFHALLLRRRVNEAYPAASGLDWSDRGRLRLVEGAVQREMDDSSITWKLFCRECARSGWDLKRSELQSRGYEVSVQYRKT
jgi:hypothetical protein